MFSAAEPPPPWMAFVEDYFRIYLAERNAEGTLDLLDLAATGFGTGPDEVGREGDDLRQLYLRDLAQAPDPIRFAFSWIEGRSLGDQHALAFGLLSLEVDTPEGPIHFPDLRLSAVIERQGDRWRMVHHHLSEPTGRQEEGESFPVKELRWFNARLQEEVRRRTEELEARNRSLAEALAEVRTLGGLLPICAACKRIRDDQGYWREVEAYVSAHTEATFSHGLCPACVPHYFPGPNAPD